NVRPFLNGAAGLSLVPPPLGDLVNANSAGYQWLYVGLTALGCGVVLAAATRIVESPFGRTLRAMREREPAAAALGKNLVMLKMVMFIAGGVIAGLSGAVLVGFIGVWAPATWLYPETIVLFAALIVGGRGNNLGALLGALLVPVGFEGVTRRFEGLRAVDGVSLEVVPGRITGLIGPNGAGKSTLLAVLAGTLPASVGRILLGGADVTRLPAYRRAQWGLVRTFQLSSEFAQLTVLENLLVAVPRHRGDSLAGALRGKAYWWADERPAVLRARALLARFG